MKRFPLMIVAMLTCLGFSTPAHAQAPTPGQPYQIPAGFEGYGPGTLIAYGGYNYVTQGDGTMLLQQAVDSGSAATAGGPVPGRPYQIPSDFSGVAAGGLVTYGGSAYVIQSDGTMLPQQSADGGANPSIGQPGFSYNSNYVQPGNGGYGADPGGASYSSTNFQLGIGIYGKPGYASQPPGQATHPTYPSGGQGYHPGPHTYIAGPQAYHPSQGHQQGGYVHQQGGQAYNPSGGGYHPSGGGYHPSGGGFAGSRPGRRR